jgi:ribosomal protein L30
MLPTLPRLAAPTHHLITLVRSPNGLPPSSRRTLESLGLYRLHQSVLHPFDGTTAGKILLVKELVGVQNVGEEEGRRAMERRRPEGSGVEVSGRLFGGGKGL